MSAIVSYDGPLVSSFTPTPTPTHGMPPTGRPGSLVVDGPQWYRGRIRKLGPIYALVLPLLVGGFGLAVLRWSEASWSGSVGLLGGVLGAPGLLLAGAPFGDRGLYPVAIGGSVVLWLLVGVLASRRSTRNPMATWSDFWRHCVPLTVGVWIGAGAGLLIAALVVGEGVL